MEIEGVQQGEEVGPTFIPLVECHGQQDADETLLGCLCFTGPLGGKDKAVCLWWSCMY